MSTPKPENRFANTWQLRGETPEEADVTDDGPRSNPHEAKLPSEPKVWYVRLGRSVSGFFSSIGDKFTALWRGVSDAADAVARFFSGKGAASDLAGATRNINDPPKWVEKPEFSAAGQSPSSSIVYFPVRENTKNEVVPKERRGMLGAIPEKPAISTEGTEKNEVVEPAPATVSPGQEKFEAYLALRSQGSDWLEYALDEDCLKYADQVSQPLFTLQSTPGYRLTDEQRAIFEAAKDLKSAHADYKKQIKEEEQKKAQKAERIRQAKEAAGKQPGQKDFEDFVAMFNKNREENKAVKLVSGSRYLSESCINYALTLPNDDPNYEASRFLIKWSLNPQGASLAMRDAGQYMEPPPPARLPPRIPVVHADTIVTPQTLRDVVDKMEKLNDQGRREMINGSTLGQKDFDKVIKILLGVAHDDGMKSSATSTSAIERTLNYERQNLDSLSDSLDALQQAEYFLKHLKWRLSNGLSYSSVNLHQAVVDGLILEVQSQRQKLEQKLQDVTGAQRRQREPRKLKKNKAQNESSKAEIVKVPVDPSITDASNPKKPLSMPAIPKPTVVSQESIKLLSQLKSSIDAPSLIMAMYPDRSLAPDIAPIFEGALPYFDGLLMSGKVDDVAKANAQMLASLWQVARQDETQLKKMRALANFRVIDAVFDPVKIENDFA